MCIAFDEVTGNKIYHTYIYMYTHVYIYIYVYMHSKVIYKYMAYLHPCSLIKL